MGVFKLRNISDEALLGWATDFIKKAQQDGAYGVVSVHLEAGKITLVRMQESYKPPAPGRPLNETVDMKS